MMEILEGWEIYALRRQAIETTAIRVTRMIIFEALIISIENSGTE